VKTIALELTVPIEQKTIACKTVHCVGVSILFVCLAPELTHKQIEQLSQGIADWHKELAPVGETQVVSRNKRKDMHSDPRLVTVFPG